MVDLYRAATENRIGFNFHIGVVFLLKTSINTSKAAGKPRYKIKNTQQTLLTYQNVYHIIYSKVLLEIE